MNWMIYPAARAFIKVCAVLFGAGAAAAVLIHLFMPFFLRSPRTAAPFLLLGTGAELLSILSLSFLMFWGARVLLASRGSRITRNLSMLAFLPALYALLIPFAGMPVPSQYTEMDRVWEAFLLLAAVTSFFSFPPVHRSSLPGSACCMAGRSSVLRPGNHAGGPFRYSGAAPV